jgi:hypothetical protein
VGLRDNVTLALFEFGELKRIGIHTELCTLCSKQREPNPQPNKAWQLTARQHVSQVISFPSA